MSTLSEDQLVKRIRAHMEKGDQAKQTSDRAGKKAEDHYKAAGIHLKALRDGSPSKAAWEKLIKSKCGIGTSRAYDLIAIAEGKKTVADVRLGTAKRMRRLAEKKRQSCPSADGQNKAETPLSTCSYCSKKAEVQLFADNSDRGLPSRYACDECLKLVENVPEPERRNRLAAMDPAERRRLAECKSEPEPEPKVKRGSRIIPEVLDDERLWDRSASDLAGNAMTMEASWTRQFGAAWRDFPVSPSLAGLAREAADAWTFLAEQLAARAAPATDAKAPEPEPAPVVETTCGENPWVPPAPATTADDYPDMPDCIRRAPREVAA